MSGVQNENKMWWRGSRLPPELDWSPFQLEPNAGSASLHPNSLFDAECLRLGWGVLYWIFSCRGKDW